MRRPGPLRYSVLTILGSVLGTAIGAIVPELGRSALLVQALGLLFVVFYLDLAVWDPHPDDPAGCVLGVPLLLGLGGIIAVCIQWANKDDFADTLLMNKLMGGVLGAASGLFGTPGLLCRLYRRSIRTGAPVINLIEAMYDTDRDTRLRAAVALADASLPEAAYAVPALLLALDQGDAELGGRAGDALRALGVMYDSGALPSAAGRS